MENFKGKILMNCWKFIKFINILCHMVSWTWYGTHVHAMYRDVACGWPNT